MDMKWNPIDGGNMNGVPRDEDVIFTVLDEDTGEVYTVIGEVSDYFLHEYGKVFVGATGYPVDTLVRVRDYENREWCLRYFKGINKSNSGGKYEVWSNGMTSKTASDSSNTWKYCELVEDDDE